jgi:hypothetical protein
MSIEYTVAIITVTTTTIPTHKTIPNHTTITTSFVVILVTSTSLSLFLVKGLTFWLRDAPTSITFNNCTFCPHCIYVFYKQQLVPLTA